MPDDKIAFFVANDGPRVATAGIMRPIVAGAHKNLDSCVVNTFNMIVRTCLSADVCFEKNYCARNPFVFFAGCAC